VRKKRVKRTTIWKKNLGQISYEVENFHGVSKEKDFKQMD
jgi:hypothetical protein